MEVTPDTEVEKVCAADCSVATSHTFLNTHSPDVLQLAMRSGHSLKSEFARRSCRLGDKNMSNLEGVLGTKDPLLTYNYEEKNGIEGNNLTEEDILFNDIFDEVPPDSVELQNAREKMASLESHIANLEKEIGDLKDQRTPSEEALHRTKRIERVENLKALGGREGTLEERKGSEENRKGAEEGSGGNRERSRGSWDNRGHNRGSWDGRGGSGQNRGRGGNHGRGGRGENGQNRGRGGNHGRGGRGENGQNRGRGGNDGQGGGGLHFNYFNSGRKSSIQVSPQDQSVYVNFTTQKPRHGPHSRNGKDRRAHQDPGKATSSGGGLSRQADNN